ncbi:hypothetical protein N7444_005609 [Penicillium canescens]|nr:hypothetical protein N7444_005609 [Penicillium canescens]
MNSTRLLQHGLRSAGSRLARPCRPTWTLTQHIRMNSSSSEKAMQDRYQQLKYICGDPYPRLKVNKNTLTLPEFRSRYSGLANNDTVETTVSVSGRVHTSRIAGSKLVFFDMWQDDHKIQVMCNIQSVASAEFKRFFRLLRRGDSFSVTGKPHRTARGELTIDATELPTLLSTCFHDIPVHDTKHEVSPFPRHVQFLADRPTMDIIKARSALTQYMRRFFLDRSFLEVNTPIVEGVAGGAVARPFYTTATEFSDRQLSLRIAPELWLKRMVVGGFDKVFEIGPSFRNEGLDKTHNPEHTQPDNSQLHNPFRRIDFITGIEEAINRKLPDLEDPKALEQVRTIFTDLSLPLPQNPSLPRLLDELCSQYVEPQCIDPTFIINPPECLSPLSKSFLHPVTNQRVAARGELFIEGKEVVNTYEEENSPFEQRRKFEDQMRFSKDANEPGEIDESYLEALEWGLPPTGGWGCGVDRLVMLFTGAKRIGDVLPFGNLRAVTRRAGQVE